MSKALSRILYWFMLLPVCYAGISLSAASVSHGFPWLVPDTMLFYGVLVGLLLVYQGEDKGLLLLAVMAGLEGGVKLLFFLFLALEGDCVFAGLVQIGLFGGASAFAFYCWWRKDRIIPLRSIFMEKPFHLSPVMWALFGHALFFVFYLTFRASPDELGGMVVSDMVFIFLAYCLCTIGPNFLKLVFGGLVALRTVVFGIEVFYGLGVLPLVTVLLFCLLVLLPSCMVVYYFFRLWQQERLRLGTQNAA